MAERGLLYLTFGGWYGSVAEIADAVAAGRVPRDPHPTASWASGNGYLAVEYGLGAARWSEDVADARDRARVAAYAWLEGHYAFDYDEPPGAEYCPLGELARMVLP